MTAFRDAHPDEIEVVDSHTEGEPTRVIVGGWPELAAPTMEGRRTELAERYDSLWRGTILEPRGHDAVVGALLTPPVSHGATAGVVFFDNAGPLWMCGHGTIGVVRTLEHLGRIAPGPIRLDTPAGTVGAELAVDGTVTIENVPALAHARDVTVEVPGGGSVTGDVAYGGNWFFVSESHGETVAPAHMERLRAVTLGIQRTLAERGVTGARGEVVDHVILLGPPSRGDADRRNYVMCPGGAYDRSPCGTGTSATMAALHARGRLALGQRWRQESITGSVFTGWLEERDGKLRPRIQGRAYITGRAKLLFDPRDPFRSGLSLGS
ncbi:MAG TPA: proline racemase family protein [Thermoanaerobaculia bacterium]|nr:proline racemase family protein [Thermoanaerobaculia bacterium]